MVGNAAALAALFAAARQLLSEVSADAGRAVRVVLRCRRAKLRLYSDAPESLPREVDKELAALALRSLFNAAEKDIVLAVAAGPLPARGVAVVVKKKLDTSFYAVLAGLVGRNVLHVTPDGYALTDSAFADIAGS